MLLEVGPSVYLQILILPLGQLRPLLDNAGAHSWVGAPGCKLRNVDIQEHVFAHPSKLDIPQGDQSPVSGPLPQPQATPCSGYLHSGHSL